MPKQQASRKAAKKGCDCINDPTLKTELAKQNAKVRLELFMDFKNGQALFDGPFVLLEKINSDKRKPLPKLFCAFCPFCGKKKAR